MYPVQSGQLVQSLRRKGRLLLQDNALNMEILLNCWHTTTKIQGASLKIVGTQSPKYRVPTSKLLVRNHQNTGCQPQNCWHTTTKIQGANFKIVGTQPPKYRVPTSKLWVHNHQNTGCQPQNCWHTTTKIQGANLKTVGTQPPKYRVQLYH